MCFVDYQSGYYNQPITTTYIEPMETSKPTANITVNKARKKVHPAPAKSTVERVFLNDGEEFEIELFNPTQKVVAAQISINAEVLSGGMLVLNPGERVFVERYLDKPVRFKFATYEVEAGNAQVEKAIQLNGYVQVKFFDEYVPPRMTFPQRSHVFYSKGPEPASNQVYFSNTLGSATMDSFADTSSVLSYSASSTSSTATKSFQETGRVSEGSSSGQRFGVSHKTFNTWSNHEVTVRIEPQSKAPITVADLKVYCTSCGRKKKDGEKFCPNDGVKYN